MMKLIQGLSVLLLLSGCEHKPLQQASGKKVYIKVIASQSNQGIAYGEQGVQGLLAAKSLLPLLPNGDEIVFSIHDDHSDVKQTQKNIEAIDENITALLTFSDSAIQLGIAPLIQKLKIPSLAVIATHDDFIKSSQYMTRLSMSNSIEAKVSAAYIRDEMLMNRVGIIYSKKSIYSQSVASIFEKKFLALGGEIAINRSIESFQDKHEDYQTLLDISGLDLIFITTDAVLSYKFLSVFKSLDTKVKIFATDGLLSDMQEHYPDDLDILNGILNIEHYSHNMHKNAHAQMLKSYFEKKELMISSFAGLGYEGYQLLYHALSSCPKYKRECVNDKLRNSKVFEGIVSILQSVDGNMQRPLYVNEIYNGRMMRKVKVY
ncbi:MAG: ABC transporter substrate-binding protein [Campylobacterota bacterium]|nr:ABC transporter substrate-binding protein [Campylobacterota bacterium]